MKTLQDLQQRALEIRERYNEFNKTTGHQSWGPKDYATGLVGGIGDLTKLVMAKENMRTIDDADEKLRHELGDCLWSLFVLAAHYDIDAQAAFEHTMDELDTRLDNAMSTNKDAQYES